MTTKRITVSFLSLFALMGVLALAGCGSSGSGADTIQAARTGSTTMSKAAAVCDTTKGASLYAAKCASCHGALESSSKQGATFQRIKAAIANYSVMQSIQMTDDEIYDVAAALGAACEKPAPADTGTTCDGRKGRNPVCREVRVMPWRPGQLCEEGCDLLADQGRHCKLSRHADHPDDRPGDP